MRLHEIAIENVEYERGEWEGKRVKTCTSCRDDNADETTKEVNCYDEHKLFLH